MAIKKSEIVLGTTLSLMLCGLSAILAAFTKPIPKYYGAQIPLKELDPKYENVQKKIVLYHNYYRAKVEPPARDMLEVQWHEEAAEDAQRWAEACQLLVHDNVTGRWVDAFGSCGQNIFVANVQVPWFFAIKTWNRENMNFTYGGDNDLFVVGHYTQLVWYSTHKVGCGFHYCDAKPKPYYNYVCNYCPIGNFQERLGRPYDKGEPCSDCTNSCKFRKLCTNSCPYADLWMNCKELNATWNSWLCSKDHQQSCMATCHCGEDKIM